MSEPISAGLSTMPLDPMTTTIARTGEQTRSSRDGEQGAVSWQQVQDWLTAGEATTWLSLHTPTGVHTRPVFAAWTGTCFVVASKPSAVKTRYLDTANGCSLGIDLGTAHLVVEAVPARLHAQDDLEQASAAFAAVYDWPTSVTGGELDAPYAAPTSGGPPFWVFELSPVRAFAFPTADQFEPTRFVF